MKTIKILVAEDEATLLGTISDRLKREGYYIDSAQNGEDALAFLSASEYDLAILDILMPKKSGLEVLGSMRAQDILTPVLLLTALGGVDDKVRGLDAGADDYLVKPFSFDELLARIRVLLRRDGSSRTNILKTGSLSLDTKARRVCCGDSQIDLTAKEYAILEYMLRNKGNILTRSQIIEHVWEYEYDIESNVIDVYVRYLRKKLDGHCGQKLIHTIRGVGYVLREDQ